MEFFRDERRHKSRPQRALYVYIYIYNFFAEVFRSRFSRLIVRKNKSSCATCKIPCFSKDESAPQQSRGMEQPISFPRCCTCPHMLLLSCCIRYIHHTVLSFLFSELFRVFFHLGCIHPVTTSEDIHRGSVEVVRPTVKSNQFGF